MAKGKTASSTQQVSNIPQVTFPQLVDAIKINIEADLAIFIWGPPGVGKTDAVRQAAHELEAEVLSFPLYEYDSVDFKGVPAITKEGRTKWNPPEILPLEGDKVADRGIIFFDDMPQAPPAVQAVTLQLFLEKMIGGKKLADGWGRVGAGNRTCDKSSAYQQMASVANRVSHVELVPNHDAWCNWAVTGDIMPEIRSYIKENPDELYHVDPDTHLCVPPTHGEKAFRSPRAWHAASRLLAKALEKDGVTLHNKRGSRVNEHLVGLCVGSRVGQAAAAKFTTHLVNIKDCPTIDEILKDPLTARCPDARSPSLCFAVSCQIVSHARGKSPADLSKLATYAKRLPADYTSRTFMDMIVVNKDSLTIPETSDWLIENKKLVAAVRKDN